MQEGGNDNVNAIIYIPFSAMGDFRDTHYLDGIWLAYDGTEYEGVERHPQRAGLVTRVQRR